MAGFGDVMQLGYVVDDMDRAIDHWARVLGVGPFFVANRVPYAQVSYLGQPCDAEISVALASHRGMQIEIIQQVGGGRSIFADFMARTGGGLHHVCALTDDLTRDLADWKTRGVDVLQGGVTMAGIPFAYLATDPDDRGRVLELVQPSPGLTRFFAKIDGAGRSWDGQDARIDLR
ncbi:VOC family protein [Phaeovulum sp. NW3]|uniref:VOC family protein n=1 Tax=Phaeovulum sp. NW3 TaxID=2934933 RepID=UPI0020220B2F|nr:VOC family protein [Phaeovulum sp. NW3]MCL7466127.1 VOC family protein [Phaeovulum sp. NW3]